MQLMETAQNKTFLNVLSCNIAVYSLTSTRLRLITQAMNLALDFYTFIISQVNSGTDR